MSSKQMFYRIKQIRSSIGVPKKICKNLDALGLTKRNQVVYQRVSPATAHRLTTVKELVTIDLVSEEALDRSKAEDKDVYAPGFLKVGEK